MRWSIHRQSSGPWDVQVLVLFGSGLAPAAVSPAMSGDGAGHWAALVEAEDLGRGGQE